MYVSSFYCQSNDKRKQHFFIKNKRKRRLLQAAQNGHAFLRGKIATRFRETLFIRYKK
jgi:hypothetical protein